MTYNKHLSPGAPGKAGLQSEPLEGVRTATGIPASGHVSYTLQLSASPPQISVECLHLIKFFGV